MIWSLVLIFFYTVVWFWSTDPNMFKTVLFIFLDPTVIFYIFWSSGFLFIRSSGFGLLTQLWKFLEFCSFGEYFWKFLLTSSGITGNRKIISNFEKTKIPNSCQIRENKKLKKIIFLSFQFQFLNLITIRILKLPLFSTSSFVTAYLSTCFTNRF